MSCCIAVSTQMFFRKILIKIIIGEYSGTDIAVAAVYTGIEL